MNLKVFIVVSALFYWLEVVYSIKEETTTTKLIFLCNEDELIHELENIQITDPHRIIKIAAKKHMASFCKDFKRRLTNFADYRRGCNIVRIKNQYKRIINGAERLNFFLCESSIFQKEFVRNAPCYEKIFGKSDDCESLTYIPNNWADDKHQMKLCAAYKSFVDCHTIKATVECGPSAADIYRKFLSNIISASMLVDCGPKMTPAGPDVNNYDWNIFAFVSFVYAITTMTLICIIICLCQNIINR